MFPTAALPAMRCSLQGNTVWTGLHDEKGSECVSNGTNVRGMMGMCMG